jgi:hypothetical protein
MNSRHPNDLMFLIVSAIVVGTALTLVTRFVLVPLTTD